VLRLLELLAELLLLLAVVFGDYLWSLDGIEVGSCFARDRLRD
jgi:hypothetical protein